MIARLWTVMVEMENGGHLAMGLYHDHDTVKSMVRSLNARPDRPREAMAFVVPVFETPEQIDALQVETAATLGPYGTRH